MREKNITILSTKELDEAYIQEASSAGITIHCIPFIQIKYIDDKDINERVQTLSSQYLHAIFTSAHAVKSVAGKVNTTTLPWKIFCLVGATQDAVKKYFPNASIIGTAHNAASLAEKIINNTDIPEFYFFCGNKRLDNIPRLLSENNIALNEFVVYETLLTPKTVQTNYDGILFFSPTAVASFFTVNTILNNTHCFAFGDTTAKALQSFTKNIIVPPHPDVHQLLHLVKTTYHLDSSI